jgi:hypothetical protein
MSCGSGLLNDITTLILRDTYSAFQIGAWCSCSYEVDGN